MLYFRGIFPETFKLLDIIHVLPFETASSVETSFSSLKPIYATGWPMRVAIELGLSAVKFDELLEIFKQTKMEVLCFDIHLIIIK